MKLKQLEFIFELKQIPNDNKDIPYRNSNGELLPGEEPEYIESMNCRYHKYTP